MARLVTEEPALPQEIVTVQIPQPPQEPERAAIEEMGEALAILGEIIETQSPTLPVVPEEPEEPETPVIIEPEANLSVLTPAPEIKSDALPPKNTPPEKPRSQSNRNGLRRFLFGE